MQNIGMARFKKSAKIVTGMLACVPLVLAGWLVFHMSTSTADWTEILRTPWVLLALAILLLIYAYFLLAYENKVNSRWPWSFVIVLLGPVILPWMWYRLIWQDYHHNDLRRRRQTGARNQSS